MTLDAAYYQTGAAHEVTMTPKVASAFFALPERQRAKLEYVITLLCARGPTALTQTQFASEVRIGGVRVYALKFFKVRLYGAFLGRRFVCTHLVEKKVDRADVAALEYAAREFSRVTAS